MNTPLTILVVLVVLGGIVVLLDHLRLGTETYMIGGQDLPDTAVAATTASPADPTETVTSLGGRS